mmetsp:Transcript_50000/g.160027  ORF Transcript_50000/g.160027 Transcript_50000/m.160027 type:complete len:793 (+) Transcript_50000:619-2997(+)
MHMKGPCCPATITGRCWRRRGRRGRRGKRHRGSRSGHNRRTCGCWSRRRPSGSGSGRRRRRSGSWSRRESRSTSRRRSWRRSRQRGQERRRRGTRLRRRRRGRGRRRRGRRRRRRRRGGRRRRRAPSPGRRIGHKDGYSVGRRVGIAREVRDGRGRHGRGHRARSRAPDREDVLAGLGARPERGRGAHHDLGVDARDRQDLGRPRAPDGKAGAGDTCGDGLAELHGDGELRVDAHGPHGGGEGHGGHGRVEVHVHDLLHVGVPEGVLARAGLQLYVEPRQPAHSRRERVHLPAAGEGGGRAVGHVEVPDGEPRDIRAEGHGDGDARQAGRLHRVLRQRRHGIRQGAGHAERYSHGHGLERHRDGRGGHGEANVHGERPRGDLRAESRGHRLELYLVRAGRGGVGGGGGGGARPRLGVVAHRLADDGELHHRRARHHVDNPEALHGDAERVGELGHEGDGPALVVEVRHRLREGEGGLHSVEGLDAHLLRALDHERQLAREVVPRIAAVGLVDRARGRGLRDHLAGHRHLEQFGAVVVQRHHHADIVIVVGQPPALRARVGPGVGDVVVVPLKDDRGEAAHAEQGGVPLVPLVVHEAVELVVKVERLAVDAHCARVYVHGRHAAAEGVAVEGLEHEHVHGLRVVLAAARVPGAAARAHARIGVDGCIVLRHDRAAEPLGDEGAVVVLDEDVLGRRARERLAVRGVGPRGLRVVDVHLGVQVGIRPRHGLKADDRHEIRLLVVAGHRERLARARAGAREVVEVDPAVLVRRRVPGRIALELAVPHLHLAPRPLL